MATHIEVAHAWAHRTGRHRKGHNMFYEGETIYSYGYRFPIATHVQTAQGRDVVLMTTAGYSISTSKHKTYVLRAIRHLDVIRVPTLSTRLTGAGYGESEKLVRAWQTGISAALASASKARTRKVEHLATAQELIDAHNAYATAFDLVGSIHFPALLSLETFDSQYAAMQEAIRQERLAQAERQRIDALRQAIEDKDRLRDWLRGAEGVRPPRTLRPMVRVKGDMLQTTWGASVPLADALRVYELAKRAHALPRETLDDGLLDIVGSVGSFGDAYVSRTGNIRVGCHTIPFRYARMAACLAGIETPSGVPAMLHLDGSAQTVSP